jgi:hypothetical protein
MISTGSGAGHQRTRIYLRAVEEFAQYFKSPPDRLGREHIRQYQTHLFTDRRLEAVSVAQQLSALRFFFLKTLNRPWMVQDMHVPESRLACPRSYHAKKWDDSSNARTAGCIASASLLSMPLACDAKNSFS